MQDAAGIPETLVYSLVEHGGVEHEIFLNACGGHVDLHLSVYELAKYLAYLRHSNEIITS